MSESNFKNFGHAILILLAPLAILLKNCDDVARVAVRSTPRVAVHSADSAFNSFADDAAKTWRSAPSHSADDIFRGLPKVPHDLPDNLLPQIEHKAERLSSLSEPYANPNPTFKEITTVSVLPDASSFSRIFPEERLTSGLQKDFEELRLGFAQMKRATVFADDAGFEQLGKLGAESGESELVLLVGHSEKEGADRLFRFGNGDAYTLSALHELSREKGFHLMVLTCQSPDFLLGRNISYREALSILKKIQLSTDGPRTKEELIQAVKNEIVLNDLKVGVAYIAPVGGATAYYFSSDPMKK